MPAEPSYSCVATDKTPSIRLWPSEGLLEIFGCSIPENADRVYGPLLDALETYSSSPASQTTVRIGLKYFNSSSAKQLLDLLKRLDDLHAEASTKVVMEWYYAPDDLDMKEAGEDYRSLLDFPVKLIDELI